MITKSEEEYIMEEAIGSKIADYLINRKSKSDFVKLEEKLRSQRLISEKQRWITKRSFVNCHGNGHGKQL
jgi:hypothetical protein